MLTLALLIVTAAPLPVAKPPKLAPMPNYPAPGRYIVRWGRNQGECWLGNDGSMWYMCGASHYVGEYRYNPLTNKIHWFERLATSTSLPISNTEYIFQMDETCLKGESAGGTVLHLQRWDPKRTDFTKGPEYGNTKIAK